MTISIQDKRTNELEKTWDQEKVSVCLRELSSNGVQPYCIFQPIENNVNLETNVRFSFFLFLGVRKKHMRCVHLWVVKNSANFK